MGGRYVPLDIAGVNMAKGVCYIKWSSLTEGMNVLDASEEMSE